MTKFKEPCLAASMMPPDIEHTDDNIYKAMSSLKYPVMATLKKDGIRGLRLGGSLLSRRLKYIPSILIRQKSLVMPGGFDVEICREDLLYHDNESIIMSQHHPLAHTMEFHVLDRWLPDCGCYQSRMCDIEGKMRYMPPFVHWEKPSWIHNADQLMEFFLQSEREDGEGICFRLPTSPYKFGRSTLTQQYLVKLTRYVREEATIIGFEEQMFNGNVDKRDRTGKMNRSSSYANLNGKDTLGVLLCRDKDGNTIRIGTGVGLTNKLRRHIWHHQDKYLGRQIVFKHKPFGKKNKPRSLIFVGFREEGF